MKKRDYLNEESYVKTKKELIICSVIVLLIGILFGSSLIAIGLFKKSKVDANYSEANKESLSKKLEIEKTKSY